MRYHLTVMTQVGRIRNNFKRLSHASPCLQGEGRVGIRSKQWVKARANSQKPKNRLLPPRLGLYRISVPAASLPYPSLAKQGRACAQSHWFVPSIETLMLITWRAAGSRPYSWMEIIFRKNVTGHYPGVPDDTSVRCAIARRRCRLSPTGRRAWE